MRPTDEQTAYFMQNFGCARKVYNLYVSALYDYLEKSNYQPGERIKLKDAQLPTPASLKVLYPYLKDADSLALCNAQQNFNKAVKKFNTEHDRKSYTKRSLKRKKTLGIEPTFRDLKGMPKFKSKKNNDYSFTTNNQAGAKGLWNQITLKDSQITIPKLKTTIKVIQHREIPDNGVIKNATIFMDCRGNFHISLCVEYKKTIEKQPAVHILGLDYSQSAFYVDSEGRKANYPHYYRKAEEKLKKEQRKLSRKIKGSNNWNKQKQKVSKLHQKVVNQRVDWLHKQSYHLANKYDAVCVEDLNLRALGQTLKLAKNQQDNGFGMFRNFLQYKLEERGKQFVKIDKWYASSKTCHICGYKKEDLQLADRVWDCPVCAAHHDRDQNAAINIKEVGSTLLAW